MHMGLSAAEGMLLHGLLEESAGNIVIKLDRQGFIIDASEDLAKLGFDLQVLLLLPHISDLAERAHVGAVSEYAHTVLAGRTIGGWIEFPTASCSKLDDCEHTECSRWYALSLRPNNDNGGENCGAIGLLRSVQHLRSFEDELHASGLVDPLTGLANRHAFCSRLARHLNVGGNHVVAIFAIDRMQALFMQYGQRTADEIQWGFAKFLESMVLPGYELAQLDGERFAVIMPAASMNSAETWVSDVLQTFANLTAEGASGSPRLSASAGLAKAERNVDWTLRQAEMSLVMARASGGMQVCKAGRQPARSEGPEVAAWVRALGVSAIAS